jgi:hypothetical protein
VTDLRGEPWRYPGRACTADLVLGAPGAAAGPGTAALDEVLAAAGAAPMRSRRPVVAYGSNADPAVLRRKLAGAAASPVAPLRTARLGGARPAVSAHVSAPGYLPAGVAAADGCTLTVVVAWLDPGQRRALDATEPNYSPVRLDDRAHPVTTDDGAPVPAVTVYDTRHGVLPFEPPRGGQLDLWRVALAAVPGLRDVLGVGPDAGDDTLRPLLVRLARDGVLRARVGTLLGAVAAPSGLRVGSAG